MVAVYEQPVTRSISAVASGSVVLRRANNARIQWSRGRGFIHCVPNAVTRVTGLLLAIHPSLVAYTASISFEHYRYLTGPIFASIHLAKLHFKSVSQFEDWISQRSASALGEKMVMRVQK